MLTENNIESFSMIQNRMTHPSHGRILFLPKAVLLFLILFGLSVKGVSSSSSQVHDESSPFPSLDSTTISADPFPSERRNFLSATLGSNMVLQRGKPAMLWGFGTPGATIKTVVQKGHYLADPPLSSRVDKHGVWRQALPVQEASKIPFRIIIQASTGEQARLDNILFGDVFLCGGQSNMQFTMAATTNGTEEARKGNQYPHIRLFTVGQGTSSPNTTLVDLQTVEQPWQVANEISLWHFSSVCWFFGRTVSDGIDHKVPIGLISNNWGGTRVEVWMTGGQLFNAMIYPYMVGPMAITGFTWYQGESNTYSQADIASYASHFATMIEQWRSRFQNEGAYFGFVQLSTWCPEDGENVALLREAQMAAMDLVTLKNPHSGPIGYATNADHGAGCNIHPPYKQYCGKRLGNSALALIYESNHETSRDKEPIAWQSPSYLNSTLSIHRDKDVTIYTALVTIQNVTKKGLYSLDTPYNLLDGTFNCSGQPRLTCAWAAMKVTDAGWVNATVSVQLPDQIVLTVTATSGGGENFFEMEGTSYGWGSVPMMTIYDRGSGLPVLPWNEALTATDFSGPERGTDH